MVAVYFVHQSSALVLAAAKFRALSRHLFELFSLSTLPYHHPHKATTSPPSNPIMPFAQLVIGSPGSGKSTYCDGMHQFLSAIGRKCSVVNLDPANDSTSYPCALDIRNLVTLEEIMADEELGPNGGVLYALEELEHNKEWLEEGLKGLGEDYVLFDCPGQVELFTHHPSLRNVFFRIQKLGYRVRFSRSTSTFHPFRLQEKKEAETPLTTPM